MSTKPQCQFAEDSMTVPRCTDTATRKFGDFWFCEVHGARECGGPSQMIGAQKEIVPIADSEIEGEPCTFTTGKSINLPDGRTIELWSVMPRGGYALRYLRPTPDDKLAETIVAITEEAAHATFFLLWKELYGNHEEGGAES